ncbi:polymer-forming cytoskeletal protein [Lysobacter antibioticus]|uniref:polymer-forming cytoskeletal protein n=1 Tax=Lysobacter antibioticus TaxID=84531 RepID=UPI0003449501|nr:polymer-forming cytoskeletal protein [Lysobacter antibioticus]
MPLHELDTRLAPPTAADFAAARAGAPPLPVSPAPDFVAIEAAAVECGSFAALVRRLSPCHCGTLFGAAHLARRLAPARTVRSAGARLDDGAPRALVGDLEVEGDLSVRAALVVAGNLSVHGVLRDAGPASRIVVTGHVRAGHIDSSGRILAGGDVAARGLIHGERHDDALEALGTIRARAVVGDEHRFEAGAGFDVEQRPLHAGACGEYVFDRRDPRHMDQLLTAFGEHWVQRLAPATRS